MNTNRKKEQPHEAAGSYADQPNETYQQSVRGLRELYGESYGETPANKTEATTIDGESVAEWWCCGTAVCPQCGHEWSAIWPLAADQLECPHCGSNDTLREQYHPELYAEHKCPYCDGQGWRKGEAGVDMECERCSGTVMLPNTADEPRRKASDSI